MEIVLYNGEIDELYELWLNVSKDMPYTEKLDIDVFKSSYLENIMAENICYLAREDGKLRGSATIHIYSGWCAVLHLFVPREELGKEMPDKLVAKSVELCRKRKVPHISPRPMAGCPWYSEFFKSRDFVKSEDYPEGLWMRKSLEKMPGVDIPEEIEIHFTENLEESGNLEALASLEADIALEEYAQEIDLNKNIRALKEEMRQSDVVYGIARTKSELAGYTRTLFTELLSGDTIVKNQGLAVVKDWRRKGLGAALLVTTLQMARDRGHETAYISTHSKNPARYLYERVGFETIEIVPNLTYKLG